MSAPHEQAVIFVALVDLLERMEADVADEARASDEEWDEVMARAYALIEETPELKLARDALGATSLLYRKLKTCRGCGCTDARACPGGCSWAQPGLCTVCAESANEVKAP